MSPGRGSRRSGGGFRWTIPYPQRLGDRPSVPAKVHGITPSNPLTTPASPRRHHPSLSAPSRNPGHGFRPSPLDSLRCAVRCAGLGEPFSPARLPPSVGFGCERSQSGYGRNWLCRMMLCVVLVGSIGKKQHVVGCLHSTGRLSIQPAEWGRPLWEGVKEPYCQGTSPISRASILRMASRCGGLTRISRELRRRGERHRVCLGFDVTAS